MQAGSRAKLRRYPVLVTAPVDFTTTLPDLSDVTLSDLLHLDSPVLADSIRRVLEAADAPVPVVAGFNSAI